MGKAKLNIWVRDKHCRVIKKTGHLHIYNCLGEQVFSGWVIHDGHAEVEMPPGCYIVIAGMTGGNIYSDRTMVIVRCGDEACVNLILPRFVPEPEIALETLLYAGGCAASLIPALGVHGIRKNIDLEEAFNVLIKTAEIDRRQLIAALENDIRDVKEHLERIPREEQKEAREYITLMEKTKKIIGGKERPRR